MRSEHAPHPRRWLALWLAACLPLLLAGCATSGQMDALEKAQYAYSAAIRWGDFEGAWTLVDPEYREENPMTHLEFERYNQVQVSGYRDMASQVGEMVAAREIEIGLVNRHNMTTRSMRYTERWRYDPAAKTWWLTSGLPDFWAGE
ncbi:hypothetical protein [Luteimonas vadosa]|uniref:Uncharacterized protein n=1 Tax=Luteimonas vadosa TaxID=1165507 RepID=A0ABP9DT47_9GAMM